ncbi:unnamed protein product [Lymnaea stagnalis]|uniref:LicD/FKTN/FKRP nucleotidyltransferase domain-containing protein n=1 Tax=Lymnaea stagnalis TaxID=6523 RepID=A0AAV2HIQ2_LYMST
MQQLKPVKRLLRHLPSLGFLRPRFRRQVATYLRLTAISFLFVFAVAFITPARNLVGYFFIPSSWQPLSSGQILQMFYMEEQRYPVELGEGVSCDSIQEQMSAVDWQSLVSGIDSLPAYDKGYFLSIASHPDVYGTGPEDVALIQETYGSFKPPMSGEWQRKLRLTFKVFALAMKTFSVEFFLCEGSMLGAYRHHGYIPWDDDMDLCMNGSDWLRVKQILHCIPDFDVDTRSYMMYKFFWKRSELIKGEDLLRVPYLDIFFFTENDKYIWALSRIKKHRIVFRKEDIFPLTTRPFEDMTVPLPKKFEYLCNTMYDPTMCVSRDYDHLKDRLLIPFYDYQYIPCAVFKKIYPFVERREIVVDGRQATLEVKKIGRKLLGNFTAFH